MVNHSLVTLTSSELRADALFLQKTLHLDIEDENVSSVTLVGENAIVILLCEELTEPCCSRQYSSVLFTDTMVIHDVVSRCAKDEGVRIFSEEATLSGEILHLCRLHLPSSAQLILVPSKLLESKSGRNVLSNRLQRQKCQEKVRESIMISTTVELDDECIGELFDLQLEEDCGNEIGDEYHWKGAIAESQTSFDDVIINDKRVFSSTKSPSIVAVDEVVPAWIDFHDSSDFKRMFIISHGGSSTLASFQECLALVQQTEIPASIKNSLSPRLSNNERLRRFLGYALSSSNTAKSTITSSFLNVKRRGIHSILEKSEKNKFHVLRALHESHWIEEWAEVSSSTIFMRNALKSEVTCTILISQILEVNDVTFPSDDTLFALQIETSSRTIMILFKNENECDKFRDAVSKERTVLFSNLRNAEIESWPKGCQCTKWNCEQRILLNCGKHILPVPTSTEQDPLKTIATCLQLIVEIRDGKQRDPPEIQSFFTSIATLKTADVSILTEKSRLAFYLNLYHTMVIHAFLALGYPSTCFKFYSFFNKVSYEVSSDIFSLTELEHCIIRARMASPSAFWSRFILPSSTYNIALTNTNADFRINFALNCGSISNPKHIFVYSPEDLDDQLNAASRVFLQKASVNSRGFVELPKVCQWFRSDFSSSKIASDEKLVLTLEQYLSEEATESLSLLRKRGFNFDRIEVKFLQYSFEVTSPRLWLSTTSEQFTIL
jgi:hypothetical protein